MAVATHVSRVAKDYAPFGYSIMEDVSLAIFRIAGRESTSGAVAHTIPINMGILPVVDADIYVESAAVFLGAKVGIHDGSNQFNIFLKQADNDGSLTGSLELASDGAAPSSAISPNTWVDMTVDQNQIVPTSKILYLNITATGTVTTLAIDGLSFHVRYRRKA